MTLRLEPELRKRLDGLALERFSGAFRDEKTFIDDRWRVGPDVPQQSVLAKRGNEFARLDVDRRHTQ